MNNKRLKIEVVKENNRDAQLSKNKGVSIPFLAKVELKAPTLTFSINTSFLNKLENNSKSPLAKLKIWNITLTCAGKYGVINGKNDMNCNVFTKDHIISIEPPPIITKTTLANIPP